MGAQISPTTSQQIDSLLMDFNRVVRMRWCLLALEAGKDELRKKFPNLPGRMIVQVRPEVIRDITDKEGMEVHEHDSFKLQPVKG